MKSKKDVVEKFARPAFNDERVYVQTGSSYEIASWIPREGDKPTEVHFIIPIGPNASAVMRLTTTDSIDTLIAILLTQRSKVWGPKGGMTS